MKQFILFLTLLFSVFLTTVEANPNNSSSNIVNYSDVGFYEVPNIQVSNKENLTITNYQISKMLLFEDKIPQNRTLFADKVKQIAQNIGTKPDYLMAVMYHESAGTLRSDIVNPYSGAVGLIQFMPDTAKWIGTTITDLKKMTNVQQLDYIEKYYSKWKQAGAKFEKPYKLFLTTFYPASLVKGWANNKNYIFGKEKSDNWARTIALQNKGFDLDKDGYISIKDYEKYHNRLFEKYGIKIKNNTVPIIAGIVITAGISYGIYKYTKRNY